MSPESRNPLCLGRQLINKLLGQHGNAHEDLHIVRRMTIGFRVKGLGLGRRV